MRFCMSIDGESPLATASGRAVAWNAQLQARDQEKVDDIDQAVGLVDGHGPAHWRQRHEFAADDGKLPPVRQVKRKRLERLRMEGFANFVDGHTQIGIESQKS